MEIFKPVIGFEEQYLVGNRGSIFSLHRNRFIKPKRTNCGYLRVTLCNGQKRRSTGVHRVVAEAFIANPMKKPTVNHINEDKGDNRVENLEWATNAEQNVHGTRIQRAREHTDYKGRKIDYASIASKHDYSRQDMCNRKKTEVYRDNVLLGVFETQKDAAEFCNVSRGKVSMCVNGKKRSCRGYAFKEVSK